MSSKGKYGAYADFRPDFQELENKEKNLLDAARQTEALIAKDRERLICIQQETQQIMQELGLLHAPGKPASPVRTNWQQLAELSVQKDMETLFQEMEQEIHHSAPRFPKLSRQDIVVVSVLGLVAVLLDIVLAGIPQKKRGQPFEGGLLSEWLHKLGRKEDSKQLSSVLLWLENKCRVPYDIPAVKGDFHPGNHRLKSLGHDPLIGLLFALFDIYMGTITYVDANGHLAIRMASTPTNGIQKWLPVIYYIGHLISDVCTSAGLPVPGWCLTQFFVSENPDDSIASIADAMYQSGYDFRHYVAQSVCVITSHGLLEVYMHLQGYRTESIPGEPLYKREERELQAKLYRCKMRMSLDTIATVGNAVKFIAPPSCGNPCALNLAQWQSFFLSSIQFGRAAFRDRTPERLISTRAKIDQIWDELEANVSDGASNP